MKPFDQLPELIQKRMLQAQVEQGNPEDPEVFRRFVVADNLFCHGFNWCETVEGYAAWNEAITQDNYARLYHLNPSLNPMTTQSSPDNSISRIDPSHRKYPLTPNECFEPRQGIIPEDVFIAKTYQKSSIPIDNQLDPQSLLKLLQEIDGRFFLVLSDSISKTNHDKIIQLRKEINIFINKLS